MGYCCSQRESEFFIPASRKRDALEALREYDRRLHRKGFSGRQTKADTLEDLMYEWGWEAENGSLGNIVYVRFDGDRLSDEDKWFDVLAPFVKRGSYIDMEGEDGYIWRWYFDGLTCTEHRGEVVFPTLEVSNNEEV